VSETNVSFVLEHDAEIIADNLKIKGDMGISAIDKVNNIMKTIIELGLFEESNNRISCLKIAKRLDKSMTSNKQMRELISKMRVCHDVVMTRHDVVMLEEIRRDKIRKEEREKRHSLFYNDDDEVPFLQDIHFGSFNQQKENKTNADEKQKIDSQLVQKKKKEKSSVKKEKRNVYGEYENVYLEDSRYKKLLGDYGEGVIKKYIEKISCYVASSGRKYKDFSAVIRTWLDKDGIVKTTAPNNPKKIHLSEEDEHKLNNGIVG
jgi:hypothetical protein